METIDSPLEYVAKAVGGVEFVPDMGWIVVDEEGNRGAWWNPWQDDGDAFRLAVLLHMRLDVVIPFRAEDEPEWPVETGATEVR